MTINKKGAVSPGVYSFTEVVDEACDKLMDRQIKHSIRRLAGLDERLSVLEQELDEFLLQKDR